MGSEENICLKDRMTEIFLRSKGWKLKVEAKAAHEFLIGLLDRGECNFGNLLHWIRKSAVRVQVHR